MRGHDSIIAMRKAGRRPAVVFLNDFRCDTDWPRFGDHATVDVSADRPEMLDLRFLVGMTVSILGADEGRAKRLMDACKAAGAVRVVAGACELQAGRYESTWADCWTKEPEAAHG